MKYTADILILAAGYVIVYLTACRKVSTGKKLLYSAFYIYMACVVFVTLLPIGRISIPAERIDMVAAFSDRVNLIPFRDIYMNYGSPIEEALLNICMTAPFGFMLPMISERKFLHTVSVTFLMSLSIELLQFAGILLSIEHVRIADITDIFTNTTGGAAGYIIYALTKKLIARLQKK